MAWEFIQERDGLLFRRLIFDKHPGRWAGKSTYEEAVYLDGYFPMPLKAEGQASPTPRMHMLLRMLLTHCITFQTRFVPARAPTSRAWYSLPGHGSVTLLVYQQAGGAPTVTLELMYKDSTWNAPLYFGSLLSGPSPSVAPAGPPDQKLMRYVSMMESATGILGPALAHVESLPTDTGTLPAPNIA